MSHSISFRSSIRQQRQQVRKEVNIDWRQVLHAGGALEILKSVLCLELLWAVFRSSKNREINSRVRPELETLSSLHAPACLCPDLSLCDWAPWSRARRWARSGRTPTGLKRAAASFSLPGPCIDVSQNEGTSSENQPLEDLSRENYEGGEGTVD